MQELLEKARPAIEAQKAPTKEQRKAGWDMRGFPTGTPYGEMIGAQAALFRLDHEWWPQNREAVGALIQAATAIEMMLTGHVEVDSWPVTRVGPLMAALSHLKVTCLHAFRRLGEIGSARLDECEDCGLVVGVAR